MTAESVGVRTEPASFVLGHKLDSVPFSAYHVVIILVPGFVGFIEGYDLALTGSLLVLAKAPFGRIFAGVILPYMMVLQIALADDLLRHDDRHGPDRRLHSVRVGPRDPRQPRKRHRSGSRTGINKNGWNWAAAGPSHRANREWNALARPCVF